MSLGAQAENTKITTLPGNHQFIQFTCNTYYHFHKKAIILTQIDMFCLKSKVKHFSGCDSSQVLISNSNFLGHWIKGNDFFILPPARSTRDNSIQSHRVSGCVKMSSFYILIIQFSTDNICIAILLQFQVSSLQCYFDKFQAKHNLRKELNWRYPISRNVPSAWSV